MDSTHKKTQNSNDDATTIHKEECNGSEETQHGKNAFNVDTKLIPQASLDEQNTELRALGLSVFNQDVFEEGVMNQVDDALAKEEQVRLRKILEKELKTIDEDIKFAENDLSRVESAVTRIEDLDSPNRETQRELESMRKQQSNKIKQLKTLSVRRDKVLKKIEDFERGATQDESNGGNSTFDQAFQVQGRGKKETNEQRMMRMGEMTPFGTVVKTKPNTKPFSLSDYEKTLRAGQAPGTKTSKDFKKYLKKKSLCAKMLKPDTNGETSNTVEGEKDDKSTEVDELARLSDSCTRISDGKRRRGHIDDESHQSHQDGYDEICNDDVDDDIEVYDLDEDDEFLPSKDDMLEDSSEEDEKNLSDYSDEEAIMGMSTKRRRSSKKMFVKRKKPRPLPAYRENDDELPVRTKVKRDLSIRREKDDADAENYQNRLLKAQKQEAKMQRQQASKSDDNGEDDDESEFEGGLQVPQKLWKKLFRYQKTGVRWLWELHLQQAGGIVGDEMGLGKTIQTIAFLAALRTSKVRNVNFPYKGLGPSIIICPTTIMHQWVKEFHKWWPEFRVAILHSSGSFSGSDSDLVRSIAKSHGILVTSYNTLVIHQELVLRFNWHYVILDEGHKIRNPDAKVTLCCKQFCTPHRIILSGSPIQNNLKELWSLFDFVFPGKLGTLPDFMQHFSVPIIQGGYTNATQIQVETAYRCACILRDTINPYLIRRMKADVKTKINLPNKNEQVLFCRITDEQRDVYEEYLSSRECNAILQGKFKVFAGLITLRKICNHPDLSTGGPQILKGESVSDDPDLSYGYWRRSGKMIVVEALLRLWKKQNRRVLLFTQSKSMLIILEKFVQEEGYTYLTMDGGTTIGSRQPLVSQYNNDPSIYLFLLTTRVGGLGVNLTGADRVIIFDPDWNPSTDMQARERAWRIGQKKPVTIYRLLTSGTIEEKIYHRQIFKQFLTNRILKDPKQRRLFQSQQLYDLFTLGSKDNNEGTETSALFAGTGCNVKVPPKQKRPNRFDEMSRRKEEEEREERLYENEDQKSASLRPRKKQKEEKYDLGDDELNRMKELARRLSRKMEEEKEKKQTIDDNGHNSNQTAVSVQDKSESFSNASSNNSAESSKSKVVTERRQSKEGDSSSSSSDININIENRNCPFDSVKIKEEKDEKLKKWKIPHRKVERTLNVKKERHGSEGQSSSLKQKAYDTEPGELPQICEEEEEESSRSNRKKKKRRHKDARFEGEKIPHLVKHCAAKRSNEEKEEEKGNHSHSHSRGDGKQLDENKQDDYVLRELFKKTGIDGAMKHDKIVDCSRPDYAIVEAEAERVAKEAAMALKRSRRQCSSALQGQPTWTGQNGALASKPRFGQKKNSLLLNKSDKVSETATSSSPSTSTEKSTTAKTTPGKETLFDGSISGNSFINSKDNSLTSSELLSKIQSRKLISSTPIEENEEDDMFLQPDLHKTLSPKDEELLRDIRDYVAFMASSNGQASTQEIVLNFGERLPKSDAPKFKAMLKQVCDNDCGVWRLKPEFR